VALAGGSLQGGPCAARAAGGAPATKVARTARRDSGAAASARTAVHTVRRAARGATCAWPR